MSGPRGARRFPPARPALVRVLLISAALLVATTSVSLSAQSAGTPGTSASLNTPTAVVPIPANQGGGFLIADASNNVVRKLDAAGNITTVAGTGTAGSTGDGGPATSATLSSPTDAVPTPDGGFLISDSGLFSSSAGGSVRKVSPTGIITTVAGEGTSTAVCAAPADTLGDGCPATQAIVRPTSAVPRANGNILITEWSQVVREVNATTGIITAVAGTTTNTICMAKTDSVGDGCPATQASLSGATAAIPYDIAGAAVGTSGSGFLIAEEQGCRIRKVDGAGIITTVAGTGTCPANGDPVPPDAGVATSLPLALPTDVRPTPDGGFLVTDTFICKIRKVDPSGHYTTLAAPSCDKSHSTIGLGTTAAMPTADGGFSIADTNTQQALAAASDGTLTVLAGTGLAGYNAAPPVISGDSTSGFSCSQGTWSNSPDSFAYQWNRDGTAITGASSSGYSAAPADAGHQLTCTVTAASSSRHTSSSATSAPVTAAGGPPPPPGGGSTPPPSGSSHTVAVSLAGLGQGTVTGTAINCPGTCGGSYPAGTQLTLIATPAAGSTFSGWSGGCSGVGTCVLTLSSDATVTAIFSLVSPTLTTLRLSPRSFTAAGSGPSATTARAKAKRPTGTTVSFVVSAASTVRFAVTTTIKGSRRGHGACTKAKLRKRSKVCTLTVTLGSFSQSTAVGSNRFHFTGRVAGKRLRPARYQLVATPSIGAMTGSASSAGFTVKR